MYLPSGSMTPNPSMTFSYLMGQPNPYATRWIHREDNTAGQQQPCQTWSSSRPKGKDPFLLVDRPCTSETITVILPGIYGLHSGFDRILESGAQKGNGYQRHCGITRCQRISVRGLHSDKACRGTDSKGAKGTQFFARR